MLLFLVLPGPPTALRFLEINATALELTWQEGLKGNSPIIKYIIEGNNETGFANDRTSTWFDALIVNNPYKIHNLPPVIVEDLTPATTYRFRVRAKNKIGFSSYSKVSGDVTTSPARKLIKDYFIERLLHVCDRCSIPAIRSCEVIPRSHVRRMLSVSFASCVS